MRDGVRGDFRSGHCNSAEEVENTNVGGIMPVYEEITTMKTEVIEECYDYGTVDGVESEDVKPFGASECLQLATDKHPAMPSYEQTLKSDRREQHIESCEAGNDFGLSEDVAVNADNKYMCDKCSYITKRRFNFLRHALLHSGKKLFNCATCGTSFRRQDGLQKHAKIHDREGGRYKCKYCEHSTDFRANLKNHERTHAIVTLLKCTYKNCTCEQQHVSNGEKSCHCDPCQFETGYGNSVRRHILEKHIVKAERLTCTVCTYSTCFERYMRDHMRIHANNESPKKYKCEYCDHRTNWKWNLKKHMLIHTNEKTFKCTYINCKCDFVVGEKPCGCGPCIFQTFEESILKGHILRKHSEKTRKYICAHCGYCTHMRECLKRHLFRKHSKAKFGLPQNS